MKLKRTLFTCLMALALVCVCLLVLPTEANADTFTEGYYTYEVSNGEATITHFKFNVSGAITIPSTLGGHPVTTIGWCAFEECINLTEIIIPDSVTTIKYAAFRYCTSLTKITIPDSVTYISDEVFNDCDSLTFNIYDNAKYLGNNSNPYLVLVKYASRDITSCEIHPDTKIIAGGAFYGCDSLTKVTIPDGVTTIDYNAFYHCSNLADVTIGNNITIIGESAFGYCENLTEIIIPDSTIIIGESAFNNNTSLKNVTIGNNVTTIGNMAFSGCNRLMQIIIPDSVTTIGSSAFYNCIRLTDVLFNGTRVNWEAIAIGSGNSDLTNATIHYSANNDPEYLTYEIVDGEAIITDCDTSVSGELVIPDTLGGYPVIAIGDSAFRYCDSLTSIIIPDRVTIIGDSAFRYCDSLTSITIPDSVTIIGDCAFYYCTSLTNVTIGDSVTTIYRQVFYYCNNLSEIIISDSVDSIEEDAFENCPIKKIVIREGSKTITGTIIVGRSTLEEVIIPDSVTTIDDSAFEHCTSLTEITIPNSVTTIDDGTFEYCTSLTSVTIPDSVTSIGNRAFSECTSLTNVTIGDSVTTIGYSAFEYCTSLTEITIPDSVTTIGDYAFCSCDSLTDVTIGDSVTTIGYEVFGGCCLSNVYYKGTKEQWDAIDIDDYNLLNTTIHYPLEYLLTYKIVDGEAIIIDCDTSVSGDITIPSTLGGYPVTTIGDYAFEYCYNLTGITIPDSVTTIGDYAFSQCISLTEITIPDNVTTIGDGAFDSCGSLTGILVDKANKNYSSDAHGVLFNKDKTTLIAAPSAITSYKIPDSVITIGDYAFSECYYLTSVTIGNSVTTIGDCAFRWCDCLTDIYYGGAKSQKSNITISSGNWYLTNATWHYAPCAVHSYEWVVDSQPTCGKTGMKHEKCNECDTERNQDTAIPATGKHTYSHDCDTKCNICNATRTITHNYAAATCKKAKTCKVCGATSGKALGHSYSNTWDTTCNTCGASRTVSLSNTAPTSFKASLVGNDDVKLTWKKGTGATHYYVYYRRAGKTDWKRADITTALNYTIKNLTDNAKYEFKVISYLEDSSGTYQGAGTSLLTFSTTQNLSAPSKVTAKLYGHDDVQVSWSKVSNAVAYKVYYKRSTASSYTYLGTYTGTSAKKANLSDGVQYTFKVVPCTKVNGSYFEDDSSKTATITTLKTVAMPKITKYNSSKVTVSWTDISGESGYQITITSDKAGKKTVASTTTSGKSKTITVKKGATYYYKIRAYKTVDGKKIYTPWSAVKSYKLK